MKFRGIIIDPKGELACVTSSAKRRRFGQAEHAEEHAQPEEKTLISMRSVITGEFQGGVDVFGFAQCILNRSTNAALPQKAARFCVPGARQSRSLADKLHKGGLI